MEEKIKALVSEYWKQGLAVIISCLLTIPMFSNMEKNVWKYKHQTYKVRKDSLNIQERELDNEGKNRFGTGNYIRAYNEPERYNYIRSDDVRAWSETKGSDFEPKSYENSRETDLMREMCFNSKLVDWRTVCRPYLGGFQFGANIEQSLLVEGIQPHQRVGTLRLFTGDPMTLRELWKTDYKRYGANWELAVFIAAGGRLYYTLTRLSDEAHLESSPDYDDTIGYYDK